MRLHQPSRTPAAWRRPTGFTLIELLVVIAVIGILIALLLPAVQAAREAAWRASCTNNMKQMGVALHNYHDAHGTFPPGYVNLFERGATDAAASAEDEFGPGWGWASMILPQMEQGPIFDAINFDLPVHYPGNETARLTRIGSYLCPSDFVRPAVPVRDETNQATIVEVGTSNYVGVYGTGEIEDAPGRGDGVFFRNSRVRVGDIRDGTSQTIAVGERSHNLSYVTWTGRVDGGWLFTTSSIEGGTNTFNPGSEEAFTMILGPVGHEDPPRTPNNPRAHVEDFWTRHRGGANFLFGDGSVRFVKDGIGHQVFLSLATRSGGEVISADDY